jgi:3-deoxy-D-manno-octulosonic-acid transferase
VGGHNPLEAAGVHSPVIFGPFTDNNREAFRKIEASGGGIRAGSKEELVKEALRLAGNRKRMKKMGDRAFSVLRENRGTSRRIAGYIVKNYCQGGYRERS